MNLYNIRNIMIRAQEQKKQREILFPRKQNSLFPNNIKLSDFEEVNFIAEGSFGKVAKCYYSGNRQYYAIKKMYHGGYKQKRLVNEINREISILYSVSSPYIIKLLDHFEEVQNVYLITEYIDGGTLYESVFQHPQKKLSMQVIAKMMEQLCLGLEELYRHNIVHRDLKLENVMISGSGIKIIDLGESNRYGDGNRRVTKRGTKSYFCPEILNGDQQDDRVDVWCVGVILYELVCLNSPFRANTEQKMEYKIRKFQYEIPPHLRNEKQLLQLFKSIFTWKEQRIHIDQIRPHPWMKKYLRSSTKTVENLFPAEKAKEYRQYLIQQISYYERQITELQKINNELCKQLQ